MPEVPEITFASAKVKELRAEASLPAKFERQLARYPMTDWFKDKRVAIKIHVGHNIGFTTIHPIFVRRVVDAVKKAGGTPFLTDGSFSVHMAKDRGYTEEVVGAPVIPAAGIANKYYYTKEIGFRELQTLEMCGNIVDADAMIVLSHGKGHGNSGFGGAIKNIAMGCVAGDSRGKIHRLVSATFKWDENLCTHCYLCRDNCPGNAISFNDEGKMSIFDHHCRYCLHCTRVCPTGAITIDESGYRYFQRGMALATKAILETFEENSVFYITVLLNITLLCDCWGFSTPSLVPDIGIVAGTDIVAVEQAALDLIDADKLMMEGLPEGHEIGTEGHLFQRLHGKDPYIQVEEAAAIGLGSREYKLVEVE